MYESKLTCFFCPAEYDLFLVWGSTGLALVWVVEIDMVLYASRKYHVSSIGVEVH